MRTQLLSHNKTAYQKIMKAFETSNRTCVVHPTGTGKSFLTAAVSENFKNVLILAPNIFVLDQVHNVLSWRKEGIEYMTYVLLMYKENIPSGYDLICLDEFHRAGAPEWGEAVDRLLEANPQAKVLGTTATPIRFLDDNRDMADELFGGNIASYMTLKDAWDRNILAVPRFVTGLFEFDKVADDAIERINKSKSLKDGEKKQRLTRINNLRLDWERSQGMPQILRKHIDKDAKRIIVFCGNIEHLKDMERVVCDWFQKASIKVAKVYNVHAYLPDKDLKDAMDGFEEDTKDGVKLMLSVNMLNEGVHIPRVNAVILLRTTSSKIIYLQQIGRCLTAANSDKPVILDMVDNITTTNLVHSIKEGFDWYEHQNLKEDEEIVREPRDFVVYDYTLGIRDAISKLVPTDKVRIPFEVRIAKARAFCEKNGRLPSKLDEREEYLNWFALRTKYGKNEEVIELKKKYGVFKDINERYERLNIFIAENDRLPVLKKEKEEYANFFTLYSQHKKKPDPRMQAILDKYRRKIYTAEEVLQMLIDFVNEHHRLPSANNKKAPLEEQTLRRWVREKLSDNPIAQELIDKYSISKRIDFDARLAQLVAFVEKYDRLPIKAEHDEYNGLQQLRRLNKTKNDPILTEILKKYSIFYSDEEVKQKILNFFNENGRLPRKGWSKEEAALDKLFRDHRDVLYQDQEIIPLLATRKKQRSFEEGLKIIEDYVKENDCRPPSDDKALHDLWIRITSKRDKDQRSMELYKKYGGTHSVRMEEYIKPLADFIKEHKRYPSTTTTEEERHLYSILVNIRKNHADHPLVKPILEEIASWPTCSEKRQTKNDEITKNKIIAFVDEHNRLPKYGDDEEENELARQWSARRDRLCKNDPVMQAILDQYDKRPPKFEKRYELVRDWAAEHGRLPNKNDKEIFYTFDRLRRAYGSIPEVQDLLAKYSKSKRSHIDYVERLKEIEAFADEHGRLPSTAHSDEFRLARRWQQTKHDHPTDTKVIELKERYPIQNKR